MSNDGRISSDGLKFRRPIEELKDQIQQRIRRAREDGDKAAADLYREVLALAKAKTKELNLEPDDDPAEDPQGEPTD
ncbi:MAG: hypothetical protein O6952_10100 [Planctomycetota bacterium]|nr:hypothetical protein [Planctomycetota bacterium]